MRLPKELFALLVCVLQGQLGRANTEIVNFAVSLGPDAPVPQAAAWYVSYSTLPLSRSRMFLQQAYPLPGRLRAIIRPCARPARLVDRGRVRARDESVTDNGGGCLSP